jgi:carboxyl-terminal processing protease
MTTRRTSGPRRLRRSLRSPSALAFTLAVALAAPPAPARASSALSCEAVPSLMSAFLQNHVLYHELDASLRERVAESYLQRVDSSRTFFLEPEAEQIQYQLREGFEGFFEGECGRLDGIHDKTIERAKQLEDFVREMVQKPDYAVDKTVKLLIDPAKRGFPKTKEARDALWRALVHFQISNYLSSGQTLEEAKPQLVHRYELLTKQIKEQEPDDLYAQFLDAFATALDPHSNYLSPDDAEDFQITMGLSLEGIGLALSSRDGYSVVEEVIPGGAADRHGGVKPKDKIIAVSQEGEEPVNIIDMKLRDVVRMIRGKKGTPVTITLLRQGGDATERLTFTIVRDKIDLEQQAAKLRFESVEQDGKTMKLAVLELPSFYGDRDASKRQSAKDVQNLLKQVRQEKADGLLLDLSRNGGGLLEYAVSISGFFLRKGGIVAVRQGKQDPKVLEDPDDGILYSGPLVVLTSRVTASASEILAGALKDYRRAIVVGDDQTFGKGTVQSVVPLRTGLGALKITTALFFRPGGESTQKSGVRSDIVLPSLSNTEDFGEAAQPYALPGQAIPGFLNGSDGGEPSVWQPVTSDLVTRLQTKSQARVAQSKDFQDVEKQLADAKKNQGVVHLDEILKKQEENGTKGKDPDDVAREEAKKPSAQLKEALQILTDYVGAERQRLVAQGGS